MTASLCPPDDRLLAFDRGDVGDDELDGIASHLGDCPSCVARMTALAVPVGHHTPPPLPPDDPAYRAAVDRAVAHHPTERTDCYPAVGQQLRDYRLEALVGRGGMGAVFRAVHVKLGKTVAVKVLDGRRWRDPSAVARFEREMKAVGRLDHPNVVRATDAGDADGTPFLVMEFVDGETLSALVRRVGPLPLAVAAPLLRQAAAGLQCAHDAGIIHRDVKPSNLMLAADGTVKVLDLGLALSVEEWVAGVAGGDSTDDGDGDADLTSASHTLGTLDYMAPEQKRNPHAVDARADVYGLGCTLWFLLVGRPPRPGDVATNPLPGNLDAAVWQRFLADDPANRFPSVDAASEAVQEPAPVAERRWPWVAAVALVVAGCAMAAAALSGAFRSPAPVVAIPPPKAPPKAGQLPMTAAEAVALQKEWADHLGQPVVVKNTLGMDLPLIPPGEFALSPIYQVTLTRPFRLAATEVTFAQYDQFAAVTGHKTAAERRKVGARFQTWRNLKEFPFPQDPVHRLSPGWGKYDDDQPIGFVTWEDVDAFLVWLSAKEGKTYRLPTRAEWVWACKAGTVAGCYWDNGDGKVVPDSRKYAWTRNAGADRPQPVGRLTPNAWGLHDMIGNVEEVVRDKYVIGYWPAGRAVDPTGPPDGIGRMTCGGSYADALLLEPQARPGATGPPVYSNQGFRVLVEMDGK